MDITEFNIGDKIKRIEPTRNGDNSFMDNQFCQLREINYDNEGHVIFFSLYVEYTNEFSLVFDFETYEIEDWMNNWAYAYAYAEENTTNRVKNKIKELMESAYIYGYQESCIDNNRVLEETSTLKEKFKNWIK